MSLLQLELAFGDRKLQRIQECGPQGLQGSAGPLYSRSMLPRWNENAVSDCTRAATCRSLTEFPWLCSAAAARQLLQLCAAEDTAYTQEDASNSRAGLERLTGLQLQSRLWGRDGR